MAAGADGVPNIIAGAPGGIDTPAQWLSFSYVRFASASARRFLTSRFRRIPFLIASDLSAFDNFRVVFLAFFIAILFLWALAFWSRQPFRAPDKAKGKAPGLTRRRAALQVTFCQLAPDVERAKLIVTHRRVLYPAAQALQTSHVPQCCRNA